MHLYSSMDSATASKKPCFIFSVIDNFSIADHTFIRRMLTLLSVDEILLPRNGNWSTYFRSLFFKWRRVLLV